MVTLSSGGGKQLWVNQARAIAIICMVLCHTNGKYSIWGYLLVFVLLLLDFKYYDYVQQ